MLINLTAVPTKWNGGPLGLADEQPRPLKSFLVQALAEAQIAPTVNGQRMTQEPSELLKRFLLANKIQESDRAVDVSTDEFKLLETCIASLFKEVVSVRLMGFLHSSVGRLETVESAEG